MRLASGFNHWTIVGAMLLLLTGGLVPSVAAQERPNRQKTQTGVSPELQVSFQQNTSFDQFLRLVHPLF